MRRKLLALLLVLAMVVSIMPLAAYAEDEEDHVHSFSVYQYADDTYHKVMCECGEVYDVVWHTISDGRCTFCGYEVTHTEHQYGGYSYNEVGHYQVCTTVGCYEIINSADHTYDENNICTVCGYQGAGEHEHIWEEAWSTDPIGAAHYHKCTICGTTAMRSDGSGYGQHDGCINVACSICGEKNIMCPTDENGKCPICGTQYNPPDDSNIEWEYDQYSHWQVVGGAAANIAVHTMVDGTCTVCGYHSSEDDDDKGNDDTPAWCDCGAPQDNDKNCVCDNCGGVVHFANIIDRNEKQHYDKCNCGKYDEWEDHYDNDGDGLCDFCRYVLETHEHHAVWNRNQYGHSSYCDGCYETLSEFADHTMVNGTCSVCGYHPCEGGNHTYGTEGYQKHVCQTCGYTTDHVDEDKDCLCDICGTTIVYADDWSYDAQSHWAHCTVCGKDYWKESHVDANKDGKCDTCGYNMNGTDDAGADTGTGSDDSGLDNVPKTGDVSILVMGAMVLLFGTGAVLAVKKYAI